MITRLMAADGPKLNCSPELQLIVTYVGRDQIKDRRHFKIHNLYKNGCILLQNLPKYVPMISVNKEVLGSLNRQKTIV